MQQLNRLFGKEISNIIDQNHHNNLKNRLNLHQNLKQNRGHSFQDPKININRKQNQSLPLSSHNSKKQKSNSSQVVQYNLVSDYLEQGISHMLMQQQIQYKLFNYMPEQQDITQNMRGILIDWLIDLHFKFKMFPQTLFTIVMIIDKYLMKKQVTKDSLQLLGATAFFIAAKYQQTYNVPELKQLVHLSANAFTKKDILKLEADIINELNFNLIMNNTLKFMEPFVKIIKMSQKNMHLTQYILELALLDMRFLGFKPSLLAASAIYLVNKIRKVDQIWPDVLIELTGYEQKDLKSCAKQLCIMFQNVQKMGNTKCLKRKFSLTKFHQVSKIRLQRRQK